MAANYRQGQIREVYYPYGRFEHDYGKKKFIRAPFVLIKFQPKDDATWQDYWMPASLGGSINSTEGPMRDYLSSDKADSAARIGLGFLTRQDLTIEEHELGDWSPISFGAAETDDTWKMFHKIGFI